MSVRVCEFESVRVCEFVRLWKCESVSLRVGANACFSLNVSVSEYECYCDCE